MTKKIFLRATSITIFFTLIFTLIPSSRIMAKEGLSPVRLVNLDSKREWSSEERINLGYMPDEVIVKFKEYEVNLKTIADREFVESFFDKNKTSVASRVINKLAESGRISNEEARNVDLQIFGENFINIDEHLKFANITVLKLSVDDVVSETIEELSDLPNIEYAEPNFIITPFYSPNESFYDDGQLWGLNSDGSTLNDADNTPDYPTDNPSTTNGVDIQMNEAWDMLTGNEEERIVAVLDTGVDYIHEDLYGVMWDGSNCVDENGSALNNCLHGYDYVNTDKIPMDDHGHGTHVAGIIAAEHSGSDIGILGVANNVKIMAVKILDHEGDMVEDIKGIQFAKENGAHIINASYGSGLTGSSAEEEAIEEFVDAGGIFIAAAGNSRDDLDFLFNQYPVGYDLDGADFDNLIGVTATDQNDEVWDWGSGYDGSNYGETSVDLGAPGANILSTVPYDDGYEFHNGTSMAAPFVSGTVALIWGYRPSLTAQQVKLAIMESGDDVADLNPDTGDYPTVTGKRLNAYNALLSTEKALVVPTITSTTTGGNWNSTSTWVGSVVPTSTDVVEINGNVTLNTDPTVAGMIINSGKTIQNASGSNRYLTVTGDFENNGTVTNSSGYLYLTVGGNLENNGTMNNRTTSVTGNLINTGTLSMTSTPNNIGGNLVNTGTITASLTFNGASPQTITSSSSIGSVTASNDVTVSGNLGVGSLTINSGKTLTIGTGNTLSILYDLTNSGTVSGGNITLNGSNQNLTIGTTEVETFTLGGTGTKYLYPSAYSTVTGDMAVDTGVTLKNRSGYDRYLTVTGNLENNGSVSNATGYLYLTVGGNLENNGTMNNRTTSVAGNAVNSSTGSLSMSSSPNNFGGNLTNTGSVTASFTFNGASAQTITSSSSIGSITVSNAVTVSGNLGVGSLTVDSGKTLTVGSGNTLSVLYTLTNSGTVSGGNITLNGAAQSFSTTGSMDVETFTLGGTGIKTLSSNSTITGDMEVDSGVTLKNPSGYTRYLTVSGNFVNDGTVSNATGYLYLTIKGDLDNNDTMSNYQTKGGWDSTDADSYDFQIDSDTPVSVGTNTWGAITSYVNSSHTWRWRSVNDGTPGNWSSYKYIN